MFYLNSESVESFLFPPLLISDSTMVRGHVVGLPCDPGDGLSCRVKWTQLVSPHMAAPTVRPAFRNCLVFQLELPLHAEAEARRIRLSLRSSAPLSGSRGSLCLPREASLWAVGHY